MFDETCHIVTIDPTQPISLLEVDNLLDNHVFRWCTDGTDVCTYDMFECGPSHIIPAGSKVRLDYTWGHTDAGMSDPTDYEITVPRDVTAEWIVYVILSVYHADMKKHKGGQGRFYFIEDINCDSDGVFNITWGS